MDTEHYRSFVRRSLVMPWRCGWRACQMVEFKLFVHRPAQFAGQDLQISAFNNRIAKNTNV